MKPEILAPAGTREALIAGVRCGADAIYLGGRSFSARAGAGNFDFEELRRAADYCRSHDVRLYLTVNTLCRDDELEEALRLAEYALSCGVNGFIVQDIGLAELISRTFPAARLHASTQASAMSPEGVRELARLGFRRVVLARELSEAEIAEIARECPETELEIFVHGALCMSVSGQCYMSAVIGQRSGNRGRCAQPCRLPFTACGKGDHVLSLKDLSLIEKINASCPSGIASLKIEGRMKRPEYVAAAVTALRRALDGRLDADITGTLKSVFSRSGFTSAYYDGAPGDDMFGIRSREDVVSSAGVLKELERLYEKEQKRVRLDMDFEMRDGRPSRLTARALGKTVCITGDAPQPALKTPLSANDIALRLSKLGGTQYFAGDINVSAGEGLVLSAASINAMRRQAVERLDEFEPAAPQKLPQPLPKKRESAAEPYYTARFLSASQVPQEHPFRRIFLPVWENERDILRLGAGVELPRGLFGCEKRLEKRLSQLKAAGVRFALCGNIGAAALARRLGFEVFGDFGLNVFNSVSASLVPHPILSFELSAAQANAVNTRDTGVIVYGRLPLMLARNCPVKSAAGCARCGKKGFITDRRGNDFPVVCSPYPCVEILNCRPLSLADRMGDIHTDFAHFYFTRESRGEVSSVIKAFERGEHPAGDFTKGLYYRGVF